MPITVICCKNLEWEVRRLIKGAEIPVSLEVMEWRLHIEPDELLAAVTERVLKLQGRVDAIALGYGRRQAFDRLPSGLQTPVYYPEAEDCIGVLLGQDRYYQELLREAGTWFFTPGWIELGMEGVFQNLQLSRFAEKGGDVMTVARKVLKDFTRGLYIDMGAEDRPQLLQKAEEVADLLGWRLERTQGSFSLLEDTLRRALARAGSSLKTFGQAEDNGI